ncbi:hypothetical protein B0A50_07966 [Salinomyces thailandicus]|uniref:25S rRNA (Uridine(2843)-N(3))-methyltransferase n=1 Tax=Salinomyces thailandicus TaxID=706561 RepID=A0A4U0TKS8_9PEZI|nr:hypothetical protein B0A50_07966 [Salinomyces thailandica]
MVKGGSASKAAKGKTVKSGTGGKRQATASEQTPVARDSSPVALTVQQQCLNTFRDALQPDEQDSQTVQEVKGHLYGRNFATAFGKQHYLQVYASRWSPSRALAYLQVLDDIAESLTSSHGATGSDAAQKPWEVVCLGGGAGAELVAFAAWWSQQPDAGRTPHENIIVKLLDIASWDAVVGHLYDRIVTLPELSKYASATAKETNKAMLRPEALSMSFTQQDLLNWPVADIARTVGSAELVTLMFTLNELYSTNLPATQRLLSCLTTYMQKDSYLLVVDSPGSYSTVSINGAEKKYPMQWLLDYTLLSSEPQAGKIEDKTKWEKVLSEASRWFRLPQQGLRYPIELENMRYQIHLYRRLRDTRDG